MTQYIRTHEYGPYIVRVRVTNSFVLAFAWRFLSVSQAFAVCHKIWLYRRDAFAAIFLKMLNLFFRTALPGRLKIKYG